MSFAKSNAAYLLDVMGRRYGKRPSEILGYHPMDGRGLLLDIDILEHAAQREESIKTVAGKYEEKKRHWNPETYKEIQENMI